MIGGVHSGGVGSILLYTVRGGGGGGGTQWGEKPITWGGENQQN